MMPTDTAPMNALMGQLTRLPSMYIRPRARVRATNAPVIEAVLDEHRTLGWLGEIGIDDDLAHLVRRAAVSPSLGCRNSSHHSTLFTHHPSLDTLYRDRLLHFRSLRDHDDASVGLGEALLVG